MLVEEVLAVRFRPNVAPQGQVMASVLYLHVAKGRPLRQSGGCRAKRGGRMGCWGLSGVGGGKQRVWGSLPFWCVHRAVLTLWRAATATVAVPVPGTCRLS